MRAVVQKVTKATLFSEGKEYSRINNGMLVLLGVKTTDTKQTALKMAQKLLKLRIFDDENGKTNLDIFASSGEIMLVSNFTLYGNLKGTNRPDFINSAKPEVAEPLYNLVYNELSKSVKTATGVFRTYMQIQMTADGPGTYVIDID